MGPQLRRLERTPDKREVGSSSLPGPTILYLYGGVAQLGERLLCKQEVIGSIPFTSTNKYGNFRLEIEKESFIIFL